MQEERFRRLLRWYPRAWRDRNGEALLGAMLDDAERQGRSAPSVVERVSAAGHGLGTRLDARLALGAALAALAVAAVAGAILLWAIYPLAAVDAAWVLPLLTIVIAPALIGVGVVALTRQSGLISEPRAVVVLLVSPLALSGAALAQVSWGLGFDAADRGAAPTGLAAAWGWLFTASWVLGAAAISVFIDALLRRSRLHRLACATLAFVAGVFLALAIGVSLISPYTSAIGAAGLALFALVPALTSRQTSRPVAPARRSTVNISARTRGLGRLLAVITAVVSTGGVTYALTGASWLAGADATAVMGQGITISLLSALPLIAAVGVLVIARGRTRPAHTLGPLMLVALALAAVAVAYRNAPAWDGMIVGFAVGSALGGAAIAWWLAVRLPDVPGRAAVAVLLGLGYAAFLGILVAPMLAFALPLLAVAFAIWTPRRPRPDPATPDGRTRPSARGVMPSTS